MNIPKEILDYIEKQWKWDEDIKQDVLVELLELPEGTTVNKSWCISRYESRVSNARRDEGNRRRLEEENADTIRQMFGLSGHTADAVGAFIAEEEVQGRLKELSPLLRTTLDAVVVEGRTPEEIAEAEGSKVKAVYERIRLARNTLQGNS